MRSAREVDRDGVGAAKHDADALARPRPIAAGRERGGPSALGPRQTHQAMDVLQAG